MSLDANQLQTTDNSLVPNWLLKWYPRRLLPTNVDAVVSGRFQRWKPRSQTKSGNQPC
jgi:hypothetical protein